MAWRLGVDLGSNSIGVAALELDEHQRVIGLLHLGVRIYSDGRNPKDKQSLAATRRGPRGQRRTRDRAKVRNARYLRELQDFGLMPKQSSPMTDQDKADRAALEALDPYVLRARGLDEALTLFELGRALFHLKRRGFKSNRIVDGDADDNGKISDAARRTKEQLAEAGARTLGEWLGKQRLQMIEMNAARPKGQRQPLPQARTRLHGVGAKAYYDFYPTRDMILDEFDQLWQSQQRWHPAVLTDQAYDALRETLAWQWPLKKQPVGKCTLDPTQERAPRALPTVQRLRLFQELNNLKIQMPGQPGEPISVEQRDILMAKALKHRKVTFDQMRKWLTLDPKAKFNLESERRKHLDGDLTAAKLAGKQLWGPVWRDLPLDRQDRIVTELLTQEDETTLIQWLMTDCGLGPEAAEKVAGAGLPAAHGSFCEAVSKRLLEQLMRGVISINEAVAAAGFGSHSDFDDGEIFPQGLPYYGKILERSVAFGSGDPNDQDEVRYGKIANPTVHVSLNQLRKVVNDLIKRFGAPAQIVVELARELPLSAEGQRQLNKTQNENAAANTQRRALLAEHGQLDSYANRLRLRLWEELNKDNPLDRRCVFSGEQISIARLFSSEVEIEHILPFARTLDDSPSNKTISTRAANRDKGNRSPSEAFADSPSGYQWDDIVARADALPANKRWRFFPDAMDRYEDDERDFLDRQLVDTQYISRLARAYLQKTGADVWVIPGRLTADIRWALGLDHILPGHNRSDPNEPVKKNRLDHRHHAVDALVVGLTDRRLLQGLAAKAAHQKADNNPRLLSNLADPWPTFRDDVIACLTKTIVSHKPDHGVQGALHNDTAYGLIDEATDTDSVREVVHRVPLTSLSKRKDIDKIRDDALRGLFLRETEGVADKDLAARLTEIGAAQVPPVRRVRIVERLRVIPMRDPAGRAYKAYKGDSNYCYDIYANPKGVWSGHIVSRFDANQVGFKPGDRVASNGTPLIMRLRVNDMLILDGKEDRCPHRVVKLSSGQITLAPHQEAGSLKARDADQSDPFRYLVTSPSGLQKRKAQRLVVTPSGRLRHCGNLQ